ncbi:BLOC-1-related complex subunit 5-like [Hyalella azteca]|uniref:BLOC-1-related complex subunit 5 n=1 Tax=Hyalella azteca TaxID=294128 RepID=A0A979FLJ8_HYAAZ|nr:BLOC-1-related complex subunit 5-like [Hyalella azteca]
MGVAGWLAKGLFTRLSPTQVCSPACRPRRSVHPPVAHAGLFTRLSPTQVCSPACRPRRSVHPPVAHAGSGPSVDRSVSSSPRPSICSDADLPYISYTVNRPIGDSPKHSSRVGGALRRTGSHRRLGRRSSQSGGAVGRPSEVVVVREAPTNSQQDADLARLQCIQPFLPIMRGALTAPAVRDPEVLERISPAHLCALARCYQTHLHAAAAATAAQQDDITAAIKQLDATLATVMSILTERQRAFARHAERLSHVSELSHSLTTCHANLNTLIETLDTLNNLLPIPDRLEPFVWTTG